MSAPFLQVGCINVYLNDISVKYRVYRCIFREYGV